MFRGGWLNDFNPVPTVRYRRHDGSSAFSERMWLSREIFAEKLIEAYPDEPELVRFYVRDVIGPRFYSHAREEYWRHFPHRRWHLCLRSLALMRRFTAMSDLSLKIRLRRKLGFVVLARPAIFERLYPVLRRFVPLPRFVMQPRKPASLPLGRGAGRRLGNDVVKPRREIPLFKVAMSDDVDGSLSQVSHSGWIGQGQKVAEFEAALQVKLENSRVLCLGALGHPI